MADKLFSIEDVCLSSYWSDDENSKLQSRERSCGRGTVTKSKKGKKGCVERKVGQCLQWKARGQCSKGDSCCFGHDKTSTRRLVYGGQRRKGRSSSPAPNSKAATEEGWQNSQKHQATEVKALQTKGARFRALTKKSHVNFGILPCVKTTSLRLEENVSSDMLRLTRSHATSQRREVRKDHSLYWRSPHNCAVSLKTPIRESLFYVKEENWDQIKLSKSTWDKKKFGKERVHGEELSQIVNFMSVVFARQNSRKYHMVTPCTEKDAPAE